MLGRSLFVGVVAVCCGLGSAALADAPAPMVAPADYDGQALQGDWFEVASTPTALQIDCHGTTVSVIKRTTDSRLELKIACRKGSVDGKVLPIEGIMVETEPGMFQVRFVRLMQMGNLHLVVLWQAADGSMAVLGSPTGEVGWIWSRTAHPDASVLQEAKAVLAKVGYNPKYIADVDQGQ